MADQLPILKRAQILDENDQGLVGSQFSATISDPSVGTLGDFGNGTLQVRAGQPGTATITVTRHADGAVATLDIEVVSDGQTLTIHLGPAVS